MYKPELYLENGVLPRRDTLEVLQKYLKLLTPRDNCKVLDIGCGPGNVTHDYLLSMFPKTIDKLVAIDISQEMISFATKKYRSISNIQFHKMDILTEKIPKLFQKEFDHAFSFYCLHMVNDHRKALRNIYQMLKPGGTLLVSFIGKCSAFDVFGLIAKNPEFANYMRNYESLITATQFCDKPAAFYNKILLDVGFKPIFCLDEDKVFEYPEKIFKNILLAINTFNMSKEKEEKFALEVIKLLQTLDMVKLEKDDSIMYLLPYKLLIALATKPL